MRGIEQIPWMYDVLFWIIERCGLAGWRRWLVGGARGRTLDIGCGTGRNLPLYRPGVEVIGLDLSADALARAKQRAPKTTLMLGSAEDLPFPDGYFDTVVSGLVFCSVSDPIKGLREVRRVLKPTGELRMIEHVRARWRWRQWWQNFIQPAWVCASGGCHTNRDTEENLRLAGFVIVERVAFDNFRKLRACAVAPSHAPEVAAQPTSAESV